MQLRLVLVAVITSCVACGGGGGDGGDGVTNADGLADNGPGDGLVTADAGDAGDEGRTGGDGAVGDQEDDAVGPQVPFGPENRGLTVRRGIVHLHSAYSHDGCAPDGYEDFGGADPACLKELRDALCAGGIDFAMQTDHPGFSKDNDYLEVIHYQQESGDELEKDDQDRPFANKITCPEGSPVAHTLVFDGTEGHKNMPIGFALPEGGVPDEVYHGDYSDEEPLEVAQAAVATVHSLGGYAFAAHTEESNISLERIIALPLDGMEIYNLHANLISGLEDLDSIFALDKFMEAGATNPDPDLALLPLLGVVEKDVEKFDGAIAQIHIAAIAATDIHRNVEIPAFCPGGVEGSMCEPLAEDYPNFVEFAQVGGPLPLSDGDRMDSYLRGFHWFSNYVLAETDSAADIRTAVGTGSVFAAFDVFGAPSGFDFFAIADGEQVEMGEQVTGAEEAKLYVRAPTLAASAWKEMPGVQFGAATLYTKVIRSSADGVDTLLTEVGQGKILELPVPGPGAYRVEISVKPKHLAPVLKGVEHFAEKKYPYIYSNAIFLR